MMYLTIAINGFTHSYNTLSLEIPHCTQGHDFRISPEDEIITKNQGIRLLKTTYTQWRECVCAWLGRDGLFGWREIGITDELHALPARLPFQQALVAPRPHALVHARQGYAQLVLKWLELVAIISQA